MAILRLSGSGHSGREPEKAPLLSGSFLLRLAAGANKVVVPNAARKDAVQGPIRAQLCFDDGAWLKRHQ